MPSNPNHNGTAHLNRYALCLTHRDMKVLREFLDYAETGYKMGKVKVEYGIGENGVLKALNKIKNARAI